MLTRRFVLLLPPQPPSLRVYPVRKGESLDDVIKKRNITRDEIKELNPGVNLDKLKGESTAGWVGAGSMALFLCLGQAFAA